MRWCNVQTNEYDLQAITYRVTMMYSIMEDEGDVRLLQGVLDINILTLETSWMLEFHLEKCEVFSTQIKKSLTITNTLSMDISFKTCGRCEITRNRDQQGPQMGQHCWLDHSLNWIRRKILKGHRLPELPPQKSPDRKPTVKQRAYKSLVDQSWSKPVTLQSNRLDSAACTAKKLVAVHRRAARSTCNR